MAKSDVFFQFYVEKFPIALSQNQFFKSIQLTENIQRERTLNF